MSGQPIEPIPPATASEAELQLAGWWREQSEAEIDMVVAKAIEYGANDLLEMGRTLAFMAGRANLTDAQLAELGCVQYLVGKMARVTAAWAEGRAPSNDTYLDIGIYVRMIQRIRQAGGWPGTIDPGHLHIADPDPLSPAQWRDIYARAGFLTQHAQVQEGI